MAWSQAVHRRSPWRTPSRSHRGAAEYFFVVHRLGVLLETFHKPLGNCSGCVDVFRLGEESGCPDSVAFFEQFIQEVGFRVRSWLGSWLGFVFLISIFYEGWEGASSTGVYSFSVLPPCILFCFSVSLTADTAVWQASGHFDRSGVEVNLQVVLVQPDEAEYHALLAEAGDCKQNTLVFVVFRWIGSIMHFASSSSKQMTSLHFIRFSHLGWRGLWGSVGGSVSVSGSCASSSTLSSVIS